MNFSNWFRSRCQEAPPRELTINWRNVILATAYCRSSVLYRITGDPDGYPPEFIEATLTAAAKAAAQSGGISIVIDAIERIFCAYEDRTSRRQPDEWVWERELCEVA